MRDITNRYKLFCGGNFCFDCRDENYKKMAAMDYRAKLLCGVDKMLNPCGLGCVEIAPNVDYVGPFYFEVESMKAEDIIKCEKEMIETCTDAIFILNNAACPGTITEIVYANSLRKNLHLFFIQHGNNFETESHLHTPCWYPILFCNLTNSNVNLYPCVNFEDARERVVELVTNEMRHSESSK